MLVTSGLATFAPDAALVGLFLMSLQITISSVGKVVILIIISELVQVKGKNSAICNYFQLFIASSVLMF